MTVTSARKTVPTQAHAGTRGSAGGGECAASVRCGDCIARGRGFRDRRRRRRGSSGQTFAGALLLRSEDGPAVAPVAARPGEAIRLTRRLAILLSGRGSNFVALADAIDSGRIPDAAIAAVISDNPEAPGLSIARARALPAHAIPKEPGMTRAVHEARIRRVLDAGRPDLVCLAGYMRVLSPELVEAYRGKIVNIHPSLLPKFPGLHVQRLALEAGERESGCTVHFVDAGIDSGPIILQRKVPILPGDTEETLSARILEQEHIAYPEAVARVLQELGPA